MNVFPEFEGRGLASAVYNEAGSLARIRHSKLRTPEGMGYSSVIGGLMPDQPVVGTYSSLANIAAQSLKAKTSTAISKIKTPKKPNRIVITREDLEPYRGIPRTSDTIQSPGPNELGPPPSEIVLNDIPKPSEPPLYPNMNLTGPAYDDALAAWRANVNRTYNTYPFGYSGSTEFADSADLMNLIMNPAKPAGYAWSKNPRLLGSEEDILNIPRTSAARGGYIRGLNVGGYINPTYMPDMKMPSFKTGIKYLASDTIAQLHAKEMVVPENMNPFNPTATNPIGGGTYYIQPTINAAPGMDENMITDLAVQKVMTQLKDIDRKAGGNINMSNRYVRAGGIR